MTRRPEFAVYFAKKYWIEREKWAADKEVKVVKIYNSDDSDDSDGRLERDKFKKMGVAYAKAFVEEHRVRIEKRFKEFAGDQALPADLVIVPMVSTGTGPQSFGIALSESFGIPIATNVLRAHRKSGELEKQIFSFNFIYRLLRAASSRSMEVDIENGDKIRGSVILVDDVYSSGATMEAARAYILGNTNARRVFIYSAFGTQ
jgi:phosphoribosylpyrophosphate synthetase